MAYVFLTAGTVVIGFYIYLVYAGAKKYGVYVQGLSDDYKLKELYPAGFYLLEKLHYPYSLKLDIKRRKQCNVIYGEKYGEYYFRLNYAQKASTMVLMFGLALLLCSQAKTPVVYISIPLFVLIAYQYFDKEILNITEQRDDEVERDFADIISKLTLLINAGMIVSDAWVKVSQTGDSTIYKEMRNSVTDMQNGMSSEEAYMKFADRCMSTKIKKIMAAIIQNTSKGNSELVEYLMEQTAQCWEDKKQYLRIKGEQASGKLMLPIIIMFVGIIVMIIVPVFGNMSF